MTARDSARDQAREKWQHRGDGRPAFAVDPGPGRESVWDYPRPPRVERDSRRVEVRTGTVLLADTVRSLRVLETASPPTFYLPVEDIQRELLLRAPGRSECEWKGTASYWALASSEESEQAIAWNYAAPLQGFELIAGHMAFYPGRVECRLAGERVEPQAGGFYGGWVTSEIVGPFKGESGTGRW